ncbi:MAG: penicillin-binding protein [Frankiales bacterium]|nr:penicillin-binding protein [Frankiales bacterium]
MLWGLLIATVASAVLVGIGYATTPVPNPSTFATAQATTLYYSDGKTVLARLPGTTRQDVTLRQVPLAVQHAVLAAEDRHFYSEPGISPTGILRALFTDIRGGEISQGGSTITQQYVKNAYLTSQRTFTRKFKEIFISIKLANSKPKSEILQDYLNTIYFGRGAYGIQAAAHAFFNKDVGKLDAAQGAVLAATISNPGLYDPAVNRASAVARWRYVIDGMVQQHWLANPNVSYPKVSAQRQNKSAGVNTCTGWRGFICQDVELALKKDGFDEARLNAGGYNVITTIDVKAQTAAVAAENTLHGTYQRRGIDKGRESALVSVQPGDGAIRALFGGSAYCPTQHRHPDACTDLTGTAGTYGRPPGSSFKPYTVIAALKKGISLDSTFSGPPSVQVNGSTIHNSAGESGCGTCNLVEALAKSINTVFVPLAVKVGPDNIVAAAHAAGIPKSVNLPAVPAITLGPENVSPLDQADAYATIAAQGVHAEPYLVSRVETHSGQVVFSAHKKTQRVFPADVMADTTFAMTKVFDCGLGGTACGRSLSGRPCAGKTGTNGAQSGPGNLDAWFVGFTPQLSTAVWYGNTNRTTPVTDGGAPLYGGALPAETWQQMMNGALLGKPVVPFPPPAHVGSNQGNASPTPSPTSASPTPSTTPSTTPSPTPTLTPSTTPTLLPPPSSSPPSPSPSSSAGHASPAGRRQARPRG